jgi:mannose-1-phosphate guanylyltransferase
MSQKEHLQTLNLLVFSGYHGRIHARGCQWNVFPIFFFRVVRVFRGCFFNLSELIERGTRMYYAVIMAGGSGTRLWPYSRQDRPKQALKLVGDRTMFQHAVDRITSLFPAERILVVTRREHAALLAEQTPELSLDNFIIEPEGRGTAPAIGLAAAYLHKRDPQAIMAVLTADHYIQIEDEFVHALAAAEKLAQQDYLVTLGIHPTAPSTGFGYIQQGEALGMTDGLPAYRVQRFTEKPVLEVAQEMVRSGQYSWNSGMFIWKVERILEEFARQMPEFSAQLGEIGQVLDTPAHAETLARVWAGVRKQTIDYGIMEGARNVVVLPVEIGWSDIGSWASLLDLLPADEHGNINIGQHLAIDTQDTLVFGGKRLVATIGLRGMVIVDTEDALLICPKDREQEVREVVEQLKKNGLARFL